MDQIRVRIESDEELLCKVVLNFFCFYKEALDFLDCFCDHWLLEDFVSYLGFVSPCIIIHSINQTNQMHQFLRFIARRLNTYSSTCFGHPHAHHQELINCSSRLQFTAGTWW